jgi:hypothetical protein
MKLYRLSGVINRENVPEPSARMLYELFKADGKEITITLTGSEHDRPLYRKPTEEEIYRGQYRPDEYVLTTASDGII